jgi:hypothetical protein
MLCTELVRPPGRGTNGATRVPCAHAESNTWRAQPPDHVQSTFLRRILFSRAVLVSNVIHVRPTRSVLGHTDDRHSITICASGHERRMLRLLDSTEADRQNLDRGERWLAKSRPPGPWQKSTARIWRDLVATTDFTQT